MLQLRITIARWSHQPSIETAICNLTLFGHMTAEGLSELPVMTVSANPGVYAGLSELHVAFEAIPYNQPYFGHIHMTAEAITLSVWHGQLCLFVLKCCHQPLVGHTIAEGYAESLRRGRTANPGLYAELTGDSVQYSFTLRFASPGKPSFIFRILGSHCIQHTTEGHDHQFLAASTAKTPLVCVSRTPPGQGGSWPVSGSQGCGVMDPLTSWRRTYVSCEGHEISSLCVVFGAKNNSAFEFFCSTRVLDLCLQCLEARAKAKGGYKLRSSLRAPATPGWLAFCPHSVGYTLPVMPLWNFDTYLSGRIGEASNPGP